MKLYLWKNSASETEIDGLGCCNANIKMPDSSNAHSGGIVILANDIDEAVKLAKKYTGGVDPRDCCDIGEDELPNLNAAPAIIELNDFIKPRVILYCDGNC